MTSVSVELITFAPTVSIHDTPRPVNSGFAWHIKRRPGLWKAAIVTAAIIAALLYFGPGIYRSEKLWRATTLASHGEELIRQQRNEEAIPIIRSAFALSPNAPEVIRAIAQILTASNAPDAMTYWNWLLQTNQVTDDDRRAAVECALQNEYYNEVSSLIQILLEHDDQDSRNLLLTARWRALRGNSAQTMTYATRAVLNDPHNKSAVLFLARLELDNPGLHQKGVADLFKLADADDNYGLRALNLLSSDPNLKPDETDQVIARLKSHPLAREPEVLNTLSLEIKRHPDQRQKIIDEAIAFHQRVKPGDLGMFAEWLTADGEAARVLTSITREKALANKDVFSAYIDALGVLKKWSELKTLLSGATVPLESYMVELYLSRCASEDGNSQSSNLYWQNAVAAASYSPLQSLYLATYAEKLGQYSRAEPIFRALTRERVTDHAAYLGLLRVETNLNANTRNLRDLLDQMAFRWPNDATIMSQDAFLNLLLDTRLSEMYQRALVLADRDPENLNPHTCLALYCLRLHDPVGALKVYDNLVLSWNNAPVPDRVVYAAVLYANGDTRQAKHILFRVDRDNLRPELHELIKAIP